MGSTKSNDETVDTRPQNASTVKKSDLADFYNAGHSPQETADHFDVEVDSVIDVLGLNEQGADQTPQPEAQEQVAE